MFFEDKESSVGGSPWRFSNGTQISYDPASTAHPIKDDSLTFRLGTGVCLCLRVCVCVCLLIGYACACLCVYVCVCAGTAHTVFYRGGFPASIGGMLVSSAPDNTPCSIIMRRRRSPGDTGG